MSELTIHEVGDRTLGHVTGKLDPKIVCATQRIASADRDARVVEADRTLARAQSEIVEARRALQVVRTGKGGQTYVATRMHSAHSLIGQADALVDQAMGT
ncbi:MAG: hypothetical protein ABFE01_24150 [Phycisphaerales bacterium]